MNDPLRLPSTLPGDLDLDALNSRLKRAEVALDWSDVREAPPAALLKLLAGLDLAGDADVLGLSTIPDDLGDAITGALAAASERADPESDDVVVSDTPPAIWTAPPEGPDDQPMPVPPPAGPVPPAPGRILRKLAPVEVRAELERKFFLDLHGPAAGPEEEIAEPSVRDRYLLGTLAPAGEELAAEEQDSLAAGGEDDDEDGRPDPDGGGRGTLLPSSLGLTFRMDGDVHELNVTARWGRYKRQRSDTLVDPKTGNPQLVWKREPVEISTNLPLVEGALRPWVPLQEFPDVVVRGRARRSGPDWVVSLFLVNGQTAPKRGSREGRDSAWLFQAGLELKSPEGRPVFLRRAPATTAANEATQTLDERIVAMLYRDVVEFAVGHGVGVHAEIASNEVRRAVRLETRAVPRFEVGKTTPPTTSEIPGLADVELDMKVLADTTAEQLGGRLMPLVDGYAAWIAEREAELGSPELTGLASEAQAALAGCRDAERRIRAGVDILAADVAAAESFRFMNRAMWLQRTRSKLAEAARRGETLSFDDVDQPLHRSWRPFQLAFILLSLPGITDLEHPERRPDSEAIADLLWFPTGGGKTEAYLGLSAYVMALRRLQGTVAGRSGEYGVAVLMRYTLRLLTLQQFQRASALLCACEIIRRDAPEQWGRNPFRIGLWVGRRVTPNTTEQSADAIVRAHDLGGPGWRSGSPHQLMNCPWCGARVDPGRHIVVERVAGGRGRTIQYCGDILGTCPFSRAKADGEGLPIVVVDEEIYRLLPALVIATVDKFAQMPWNGAVEALFGQVDGRCQRHGFRTPDLEDANSHPRSRTGHPKAVTETFGPVRPPDLIIQDELHLISGPLGTLVGLYETAVDRLATWTVNGHVVRPKVIASTATIRRASDQVHAVFRRQVRVFPPPGLDYRDSFFARVRAPNDAEPGRLYLGVCAQGRRMKATLIRVYTALLSGAQALYDDCGTAADPWMTTVGYFSSMRELGGMRRLVDDDIASRLRKMDRRGLAVRRLSPTAVEELTSRKSSTDIPQVLDRLEVKFDPQQTGGRMPFDIVLATNMVSVGVDVQRLGLMVVCGQPKTTAEYIQATSRVGRGHPGLVVTVYNWARPRDLSHYERFEHYHATFYTHVEALSVTPFASRALDRALFAVLGSMVRLAGTTFNGNDRAGVVRKGHPVVAQAVDALIERAAAVAGGQVAHNVRDFLLSRLDLWEALAAQGNAARPLGYRETAATKGLLKRPSDDAWGEFTCLLSLRDVEPTVDLVLQDARGLDQGRDFTPRATAAAEEQQ